MNYDADLAIIAHQEQVLQFTAFDEDDAFKLGGIIRDEAMKSGFAMAIDIRFVNRPLFFFTMPGTGPDNVEWIRRKINTCQRFLKSSYAVGRGWAKRGVTPSAERGLDPMDYVGAGGAFPLRVKGAGVIGAITVSGVPERDDHMLVVRAVARFLGVSMDGLELPPEG